MFVCFNSTDNIDLQRNQASKLKLGRVLCSIRHCRFTEILDQNNISKQHHGIASHALRHKKNITSQASQQYIQ
ncbi:hypothetical protein MAR_032707 [Mya arenaria]|uniref:Uncharacterized protein n=1 Tax=Mya arenaria TaxID=6604 RepID=A0ABY7FBR5_MYAAR|nr:hypothetical protein MAR_032707 [Mya arenaria]